MASKEGPLSLESLTPKARQVILLKRIEERKPAKAWRSLLTELAGFDSIRDRLYAKASRRRVLFFVLFGILFVLSFLLGDALGLPGVVVGLLLSCACLVLSILFHSRVKKLRDMDLMSDFRTVLIPLLKILQEDLTKKVPVRLSLNLVGLKPGKVIREGDVPPGRFKRVTERLYRDRWCAMSVRMADGSMVRLRLVNLVLRQERQWTNPRRKTKFKVKWKKVVLVSATLFPSVEYLRWNKSRVQERARVDKVRIVKRRGIPGVRITRKFKFKTVGKEPVETIKAKEIVRLLMHLYAMTRPVGERR
ncbi:MAG: hypothetical protein JXL84_21590 [Deltaproteobacteria bacterium]|nr:hypothetical protein [Deltaproteobacteria bacterium]